MPRPQSPTITRAHFEGAVAAIRGDIRDFVAHFNKSQGKQNDRLDRVDARLDKMDDRLDKIDVKLDAIMEMLAMRRELKNLVRELQAQGIAIDAAKVFVGKA
jgi:hypothetical protein